MRALVTGATGKIGNALVHLLAERGHEVRALLRDPVRAAPHLPAGAETVQGDVTDPGSLPQAVEGCDVVFNAMGLPEQWLADENDFHRVNALGSENVTKAARAAGVPRFVHTSTIDVFHAERGARFDESNVADYPKGTPYERSKQEAERLVLAAAGDGLEVVIANPSAVYGPGPGGAGSSFEENLMRPIVKKRLPAVPPGGMGVTFNRGAADALLRIAERGRPGERYIVCDRHATMKELADSVVRIAGRGRVPPVLPVPVAKAMAGAGEALSRAIHRPPLLPRGQLYFFLWDAAPDSSKVQEELGWEPTPLDEGLRVTLAEMDPPLD
ncbi:MAG TPA: NAD-dependent epimerase/dehydratase family protein [Thermoleophilaceae bacterium]